MTNIMKGVENSWMTNIDNPFVTPVTKSMP